MHKNVNNNLGNYRSWHWQGRP